VVISHQDRAELLDNKFYLYYGEVSDSVDASGQLVHAPHGKGLFVWKKEKRFFEAWTSQSGKLNGRGR